MGSVPISVAAKGGAVLMSCRRLIALVAVKVRARFQASGALDSAQLQTVNLHTSKGKCSSKSRLYLVSPASLMHVVRQGTDSVQAERAASLIP